MNDKDTNNVYVSIYKRKNHRFFNVSIVFHSANSIAEKVGRPCKNGFIGWKIASESLRHFSRPAPSAVISPESSFTVPRGGWVQMFRYGK